MASAYNGRYTGYGKKTCSSESPLATKIRADGSHVHTINHNTRSYADAGYVRNTYYGYGASAGSYAITGGIGYYDVPGSYGYCAS